MIPPAHYRDPRLRHRRGSVYLLILATAMVVSVIGMSAIVGVRAQFRSGNTEEAVAKSRVYAQSAIELVLLRLGLDASWRSKHVNDEWQGIEQVGEVQFTYKLVDDVNANLTDDPTAPFRVHTKASVDNAIRQYSVQVEMGSKAGRLRFFPGGSAMSQDKVVSNRWWAQYFKPTLPADATGWWVTSVELVVHAGAPNRNGAVRLYKPLVSNMPSNTMVDEASFASNDLPPAYEWYEFIFDGQAVQDPDDGLCIALTTSSPLESMWFEYEGGGVTEADSGFITGDPLWDSYAADKALRYRVNGVYVTALSIVPTTWTREVGP